MSKNQELIAALRCPALESHNNGGYVAAFDAILAVDPANVDDFRQAILDQKVFFNGLNGLNLDKDDKTFLDPNPAQNNLSYIRQTIIYQRVQLALKQCNEALLTAIVNAPNENSLRTELAKGKAIFGDFTKIPGWQETDEVVITNHSTDLLRAQAQTTLLLKKIQACNDFKKIEALLYPNPNTILAFQAAAVALGYPNPNTLANQLTLNTHQSIQREAAKKYFELVVPVLRQADIANRGLGPLNGDNAAFRASFANSHYLNDADIPWAKGLYGARFLTIHFGSEKKDVSKLVRIASETTHDNLRTYLKKLPINGAYIDLAVTAQTLPGLRQVAASQALKLQIEQCKDKAVLDQLIAAKTPDDIKKVLEKEAVLGFNTNSGFREAFTDKNAVIGIVAAAHVRQSLLTPQPDKLKSLIAQPTVEANYNRDFVKPGATVELTNALTQHFADPENVRKLRQEAFLAYAKASWSMLSEPEVKALAAAANNINLVKQSAGLLLGGVLDADDLLGNDPDKGLAQQFRAYATVESLVRDSKVPNNYGGLKAVINNLNILHEPYKSLVTSESLLTEVERRALKLQLAANIINSYPDAEPIANLTAVAQAKTLDDFRFKLGALGFTNLDWADDKAKETIQKVACGRAIRPEIDANSLFQVSDHPKLIELVTKLTVEKQQLLLAKPEVVIALMQAQNPEEVKKIVGDNTIDAKPLIAENKRLSSLARIQNAEIAEGLASIVPPLSLSDNQVAKINDFLQRGANHTSYFGKPGASDAFPEYVARLNKINDIVTANKKAFYYAFGVNSAGNGFSDTKQVLQTIVANQHTYNIDLFKELQKVSDSDKAVLRFFLTLEKEKAFPKKLIPTLLNDFKTAKSREEFLNKAKASPYKDIFTKSLEGQLTPALYKGLKQAQKRQELLTPVTSRNKQYEKTLEAEKAVLVEMQKIYSKVEQADKGVRDKLINLGKVEAIEFLNPAFQAAAKANAAKMLGEYTELARGCDLIVAQYKHQKEVLEDQLASLPTKTEVSTLPDPEQQENIEKRRKSLEHQVEQIKRGLALYEPVQRLLNGNPSIDPNTNLLMHQGILKTIKEIDEGKKATQFLPYGSSYNDVDMSKLDEHLKQRQGAKTSSKPARVKSQGGKSIYYSTVDNVEAGKFREHSIGYRMIDGTMMKYNFIEVHDSAKPIKARIGEKGEVAYSPSSTLILHQFPQGPNPYDADLRNARVTYSLAAVNQILAGHAGTPKEGNALVLESDDPNELEYLYSAAIAIGKNSKPKFGEEGIKLIGPFHPDQAKEWMGSRFKSDSVFAKDFKSNPIVQALLKGLEEADKNKKEGRDEIEKNVKAVTGIFRTKLDNLKEIEADLKNKPSSPTLS